MYFVLYVKIEAIFTKGKPYISLHRIAKKTAVTAYFLGKQLSLFLFALQREKPNGCVIDRLAGPTRYWTDVGLMSVYVMFKLERSQSYHNSLFLRQYEYYCYCDSVPS